MTAREFFENNEGFLQLPVDLQSAIMGTIELMEKNPVDAVKMIREVLLKSNALHTKHEIYVFLLGVLMGFSASNCELNPELIT